MNRSFREQKSLMLDSVERQRQQLRASVMAEKEEELALFLEMRRREKEPDSLLLNNPEEFDTPLGAKPGTSPVLNISMAMPARKTAAPDDFLTFESDKNDYEWLLTPPGTPLFPSLEMESQKTTLSQTGDSKGCPTTINSRLANSSTETASRNNISSRQPIASPGLSSSSGASRRPSSSGGPGSRPVTPSGKPTLTTNSKSSRPSTPTSRATLPSITRPSMNYSRSTISTTRTTSTGRPTGSAARLTPTGAKPTASATRPSGPASRSNTSTTKPAGPSRSTTPMSRSTARSSTPTSRPSVPPRSISRSATPTQRPITSASAPSAKPTLSRVKPSSPVGKASPVGKTMPMPSKIPASSRGTSPTARSRPWKPSDMPGFSLETPPNLRTTLPERPLSVTRGRPGAPSPRSASVEPGGPGRPRRQSCSPSRGRAPMHSSGSSVPAVRRGYSKVNDNVNPVVIGTKMVERVMNMRKLVPPRADEKSSPHSNLSAKSSSPDSSGFGRTLSKKSLDMAMRHMDIRRSIPGNLRPLMTNIPASSMYSVRSGHARSRPVSVSDSPLATSSNASSEISFNNNNNNNNNSNGLCLEMSEREDEAGSERGCRSPASVQGR